MLLTALLLAAEPLLAQRWPPYSAALTEPDQELDNFAGGYAGIHRILAQLCGVRGVGGTVYWVSAEGRQLTAYQHGKQVWRADMAKAFAAALPRAIIRSLVLSTQVVFITTTSGGHAEVSRATGKVLAIGVDAD